MTDEKKTEKKEQSYPKPDSSANTKVQPTKDKKVSIMFRENRKFDLHIGRDMVTFMGRESKSIPASWLRHRDWANVQKLFVVKGV